MLVHLPIFAMLEISFPFDGGWPRCYRWKLAIIRESTDQSVKCVIYVWDCNISGFVAAFSRREIDTGKNIRIVGCQSLDEQVNLSVNFHGTRKSFDRDCSRFLCSSPLFHYNTLDNLILL